MASDRQDQGNREILEALRSVLQETSEPVTVLEAILRQAVRRTGAERALIAEVLDGGELRFSVLMGFRDNALRAEPGGFSRSVFDRVLATGETVRIENALLDPFFGELESVRALRAAALLCMPIHVDGRIAALLHLEDARPGHFEPAHAELLRALLTVGEPALGALRAARATDEPGRDRARVRQGEPLARERPAAPARQPEGRRRDGDRPGHGERERRVPVARDIEEGQHHGRVRMPESRRPQPNRKPATSAVTKLMQHP